MSSLLWYSGVTDDRGELVEGFVVQYGLEFHAHSFLALSKSKTLKELHLKGCLGIEDCVPYASLAATFGFPSLELLDLRSTHVSDSDISCFNRVEKLKKLYLEALDWPGGENKISDIGVASFGSERDLLNANPVGLSFVLIRNQRPGQSGLETLVLRNYRSVTDISLKHTASCLPNLKYLDVRGTSCTQNGVSDFKRCRPDVELLTDFNNNLLLESTS
ncbi:uncharacterized protein LOC142328646 [Lycorma delicatula]|uniref:uncharacterized protein LOC142328646 n=1 Tax=Lycorma delicatula TaxID=130591 RepID=UPI003F517360